VRVLRERDGTAAIEFAFVAPLFLMLLFGTVEFGRLFWTKVALQEAALAGAHCIAVAQGKLPDGSCVSGGSHGSSATQSYVQVVGSQWGITLSTTDIPLSANANCGGTTGFSEVTIISSFTSAAAKLITPPGTVVFSANACYPNNS
jgi:hypothetical protein